MHSNWIIPSLGVYVDNRKLLFSSLRVYIVITNSAGTRELELRTGEGFSGVSRWLHSQEPVQIYNILKDDLVYLTIILCCLLYNKSMAQ